MCVCILCVIKTPRMKQTDTQTHTRTSMYNSNNTIIKMMMNKRKRKLLVEVIRRQESKVSKRTTIKMYTAMQDVSLMLVGCVSVCVWYKYEQVLSVVCGGCTYG